MSIAVDYLRQWVMPPECYGYYGYADATLLSSLEWKGIEWKIYIRSESDDVKKHIPITYLYKYYKAKSVFV